MKKLLFLIILTIPFFIPVISNAGNPFPTNTELGRWKLNDNAGNGSWLDDSGNGITLTGSGSPLAASGHTGGTNDAFATTSVSMLVSGGAGGGATLDVTDTTVTIAGWIKPVTYSGGSFPLFGRGNSSSTGYKINISSNVIVCYMDGDFAISDTSLVNGTWYHVACVYNGTDIRVYLNGVLDDATPTAKTDAINSHTGAFQISGANSNEWHVDDVVVFAEALTAAEVLTLGGGGFGADFADLSSTGVVSSVAGFQDLITSLNAATATGAGSVLDFGTVRSNFTYRTVTTGSPTGVTVLLEGSLDCSNYETLDTSTSTTGEMRHVVNKPVRCVRNNLSVLSGGTSPTVTSVLGVGVN